ncbi:MAG: adenylosuccinate lyase, partial [Desulfofustis sp.]|nr:adenylosuccinate lyase [Desulfofustis sp.]
NITSDMVVYPGQINKLIKTELPFMATEKIIMDAVEKGESRQEMHEVIKVHSIAAGKVVKDQAGENDLLQRLGDDDRIPFSYRELLEMTKDILQFTGRAEQQTEEFLNEIVYPLLEKNKENYRAVDSELNV